MTHTRTPDRTSATPAPPATPSTAALVGLLLADAEAYAADCPPTGNGLAAVLWLVHHHPTLARLLVRVPTVVGVDPAGREPGECVVVDLDALAVAVADHDAHTVAWTDYATRRPAPRGDDAYALWAMSGPHPTPGADAVGRMSGTERTRLRLLAAFAPTTRTRLNAWDLTGLDDDGRALLTDWADALLTH